MIIVERVIYRLEISPQKVIGTAKFCCAYIAHQEKNARKLENMSVLTISDQLLIIAETQSSTHKI